MLAPPGLAAAAQAPLMLDWGYGRWLCENPAPTHWQQLPPQGRRSAVATAPLRTQTGDVQGTVGPEVAHARAPSRSQPTPSLSHGACVCQAALPQPNATFPEPQCCQVSCMAPWIGVVWGL